RHQCAEGFAVFKGVGVELRSGRDVLFPLGSDRTPRLWIVATTPGTDGVFAIVSLTSLKGSKDHNACANSRCFVFSALQLDIRCLFAYYVVSRSGTGESWGLPLTLEGLRVTTNHGGAEIRAIHQDRAGLV